MGRPPRAAGILLCLLVVAVAAAPASAQTGTGNETTPSEESENEFLGIETVGIIGGMIVFVLAVTIIILLMRRKPD